MKRALTQKVKITPSCAAEFSDASSNPVDRLSPVGAVVPTGGRHRRTAAMIGLAISMGATGILLPQGDRAIAAEAAETPAFTPPTIAPETLSAATQPSVEPEATSEASAPVLEHKVQQGENLWELSQAYTVAPEAIAASNDLTDPSALAEGQLLKIPSSDGIVHQVKPGETVDTVSRSYGVAPSQISQQNNFLLASAQLPEGEAILVPGNVNTLQKARQEESLNRLKGRSGRVNSSLAELRSEESPSYLQSVTPAMPLVAAVPSASTVNQAELPKQESVTPIALSPSPVTQLPVIIPVPTPETSASPVNVQTQLSVPSSDTMPTIAQPSAANVQTGSTTFPSPTSLPVPTPEVAVTPTGMDRGTVRLPASISLPVPTPEVAVTPANMDRGTVRLPASISLPVPTPEVAVSPEGMDRGTVRLPAPISLPVPTPEISTTATEKNEIGVPTLPTGEAPVVSVTAPPAQSVPSPLVASIPTRTLYQVRRGDTLNAIARRYGISTEELIRANGIGNPNQIRVDQRLTIPSEDVENTQTVSVLPALNANKSDSGVGRYARTEIDANAIAPDDNVLNAAERENLSRTYVERLRLDVARMRDSERYRNGQDLQTDNVVVPSAPVVIPTAPNANLPRATVERQPFNFNRQPDIRVNGQNQRSQSLQAIQIPVPAAQTPSWVATAPAGSETYNPALQVPVGETVSPNQSPDPYFPGNPSQMTGYIWPARGTLTSGYGRRWGRMHRGIDIAAPIGTPIMAAAPGVVVSAGWNSGGYGNLVEIRHPDGSMTRYAHNNRILVSRGQIVEQGQQISEMGSTGRSTGPHCHFEVHPTGQGAVNPVAYLPRTRS